MKRFIIKKSSTDKPLYDSRYAVTFGEVAILHVGGEEFGDGIRESGFSTELLKELNNKIPNSEYIPIVNGLPEEEVYKHDAGVLVIRCDTNNKSSTSLPVNVDDANKLYKEQDGIEYDTKYWDNRRQRDLFKRARLNIVFGDNEIEHSEDYKQPSVRSFYNLPYLNKFRGDLESVLGDKASGLQAEGNHYNHGKSGIGYHGDAERKTVICLSLGKKSILRYHWRNPGSSDNINPGTDIELNHGDVYIMSEKATGYDWKHRSKYRLVHGAGYSKYID